jgi:hypothetical protein
MDGVATALRLRAVLAMMMDAALCMYECWLVQYVPAAIATDACAVVSKM